MGVVPYSYAAFLPAVTLVLVLVRFPPPAAAAAANNFTFPFLPPFIGGGNMCDEENVCGKGKCVKSENSSFGFECECEAGWTQARFVYDHHHDFFSFNNHDHDGDDDDDFLNFLPCVIPNCTFNHTCANDDAPAGPVSHNNRGNLSFFDPCFWTDCGGGSCNTTSPFTHTCLCEEGYYNLFNSTAFPCYKDCSIGLDCKNLGLDLMNTTNSSNPTHSVADDTNTNGVRLNQQGLKFGWWITMLANWALMRMNI